jgi:prophage regulatory protein
MNRTRPLPAPAVTRLIRRDEVLSRTGLRETQCDVLEAEGRFPQRVPLGPRTVAWVQDEVDQWVAGRIAARTGPSDTKGGAPGK